jgi:hypothetical protein
MRVALHAPGVHIQMSSLSLSLSLSRRNKKINQHSRQLERKHTLSLARRESGENEGFALIVRANMGNNSILDRLPVNRHLFIVRVRAYANSCFAEAAGRNRTLSLLGMQAPMRVSRNSIHRSKLC